MLMEHIKRKKAKDMELAKYFVFDEVKEFLTLIRQSYMMMIFWDWSSKSERKVK